MQIQVKMNEQHFNEECQKNPLEEQTGSFIGNEKLMSNQFLATSGHIIVQLALQHVYLPEIRGGKHEESSKKHV